MLSIENLTKSYGDRVLFDQVSLKLNRGEHVGLVGRNGHGKTTLLRMIVGEETADSGGVVIPKNYRIGYLTQELDFSEVSVLAEAMKGLSAAEKGHHWKAEKVLAGLGFSEADQQRHPADFSGGYQVRLNLAKVLVSEPDLLLLDEPTNFLDIASIRWLERFLKQWPREILLITHDRGFMDRVVTHIAGIHRRKLRKIAGDTGKFYEQIAQEDEIHEKTRLNEERRKKEIEQFITRFRAKARLANLVQSRIKTLSKMSTTAKLEKIKDLDFSFRYQPFSAKQMVAVENLRFGYRPDRPIIQNFNLTVQAKDRIAVIGKNGRGKTTLLRLIAESLAPDAGEIRYHADVRKGIYEQSHQATLSDRYTVEEEILYSHPQVDRLTARNICGAMLFEQDAALKKIGVLSGGEKSRVLLGKILVTPVNLLLLDEPTNHLDMDAADALLAAIDSFEGAVIMVTHNEMYLHALAERLVIFQNDEVDVFEGTYQDFLEKRGWADEIEGERWAKSSPKEEEAGQKVSKKEARRRRSEIISARSRAVAPLEKEMRRIEADIEKNEAALEKLNNRMLSASQENDGMAIQKVSKEIHRCQTAIDAAFEKLSTVSDRLDNERKRFESQLASLD